MAAGICNCLYMCLKVPTVLWELELFPWTYSCYEVELSTYPYITPTL